MSLIKKRNVHPPEFKAKIALEAIRGAKTINEIAQDYGVHPVTVSQWKKEMQDHAKSFFEGKRGPFLLPPTVRQSVCMGKLAV